MSKYRSLWWSVVAGCALPLGAWAQTELVLDFPAQPLAETLRALGKRTETNILIDPKLVKGIQAPALKGVLTTDEALRRLLSGTTLSYQFVDAHTVVLKALPAETSDTNSEFDRSLLTDEVVVTGTNIKGVAPAGSPVIVIDQETIRRSGYSSTEQLLQSLPQNVRSGSEGATADGELSAGSLAGLNGTKGTGVNLRGLGSVATLTLINGRRIAASGAGTFTDISLIPLSAIERIEILSDGASAIYGADAVGGVVNFILKQDFKGSESQASYGFTTEDGLDEWQLTHTVGSQWDSGNALFVIDYKNQSELLARDRDVTSTVRNPTSIFPENKQIAVVFSGRQRLADKLSAQADVQFSHSERTGHLTYSGGSLTSTDPNTIDRINAALGLTYELGHGWEISLDGVVSREDVQLRSDVITVATGAPNASQSYVQDQRQDQWSSGIKATGPLFDLPGGSVGLAVGASTRSEDYFRKAPAWGFAEEADRTVDSVFAEVHVPLVGPDNAMKGVRSLEMSLAARYDDYSDFGDTANPKIGISWSPIDSLEIRSSYSTSFRAPSAGRELADSNRGIDPRMFIYSFTAPDGVGYVPVIQLFGSSPLVPEESKNWTLGFTFRPESVSGLEIGLTYFDIKYTDRIIAPPFDTGALLDPTLQVFVTEYASAAALQAALAQLVNGPVSYYDATGPGYAGGFFGPNPENIARYTYESRWINAGKVDISGFDLTLDYGFEWRDNQFRFGFNASHLQEIMSSFAPGVPSLDLVDTTGNPLNWRVRTTAWWSRGKVDAALAVNYADSYVDTSGAIDAPVRSYVTVDANLRYALGGAAADGKNLFLSLSVINLLDEQPPYVAASGRNSHYDGANASPLGRMVTVGVSKRW
ncbi:TonB-dependent receptor [Steroidobacter sp.]|uniref:TonB-dependent receptor n=1 Tax=Steroidobacter sp. TaxID=1978227 RepID=UPI001A5B2CE4|nr:TonB-dependent receptor [Steroidobacter sp.]MBL8268147.1 TonB-dependent receptor [Steroidobacter sp.]